MQSTTTKTVITSANTTSPPQTTTAITSDPIVNKSEEADTVIATVNTETEYIEITETESLITESALSSAEETTAFTEIAEEIYDTRGGGVDSNLVILIVIIILAALGGGGYYFWKKKQEQSKTSDEKTAQDFINVRDTGDNCLYTVDEKVFVYLKIDGMSLELYEQEELGVMSRAIAAALVRLRFPKKFLTVSQPMDLKTTLQKYTNLQQNATIGHKALLEQEISELVAMAERGETLERQHYAIVWGDEENEEEVKNNANELLKALTNNGVSAEILDKDGIAELCNVVNIPAYSHMENSWDFGDELLEAIIKQ